MFNQLQKNKKYIVLKDGNNYGLMVGLVVLVLVMGLLFTSKMWLPDTRQNLTTKLDSELYFTLNTVRVEKYNIDYKTHVGEVLLTQEKAMEKGTKELSFKVFDDKGNELPFEVIQGNQIKKDKDSVMGKQQTLIQFGVYDDIYYVEVQIAQKDTTTQSIYIDYRNFKNTQVLEKGKDYLVDLEKQQEIVNEYKKEYEILETQEKALRKEIKALEKEETVNDVLLNEKKQQLQNLQDEKEVLHTTIATEEKNLEKLK
ncbi:MAG: hypothetical protein EOM50_07090 [Erysipelotrichia bacterium]|nr:hypothetical protein [Erysipelotrichia bacterium]NCC55019.1 hypothetical protein [Erysipelotrichia bacterium]